MGLPITTTNVAVRKTSARANRGDCGDGRRRRCAVSRVVVVDPAGRAHHTRITTLAAITNTSASKRGRLCPINQV
jgi:hypothetical protein